MIVVLGNRHAIESLDNGKTFQPLRKGKRATRVEIPEEYSLSEAFKAITDATGIWAHHASEGAAPAWVASDSAGLATLLAEHFGGIEVRDLDQDGPRSGGGSAAGAVQALLPTLSGLLALMLAIPFLGWFLARTR